MKPLFGKTKKQDVSKDTSTAKSHKKQHSFSQWFRALVKTSPKTKQPTKKPIAKPILTERERAILEKKRERIVANWIRVGIGFGIYLSILLFVALCIFVSIWLTKQSESTFINPKLYVVEEEKNEKLKPLTENGTLYFGVSVLERFGDFIYAGDYSARTVRFTESGDTATFAVNSSFCIVNGMDVNLEHPVLLKEGELYLPISFIQNYMTGISLINQGNDYEISATGDVLGYKLKIPVTSARIPETDAGASLEFITTAPTFISDLSAYERYMNPGETTEYLTLVNLQNGIAETYRPNDLTGVEDQYAAYPGGDYHARLRLYAAKALDAMIREGRANGYTQLHATSGYRSYAEQKYRFNTLVTSLKAEGLSQFVAELHATKTIHKPGYSEYQTGLCADVRFPNDPIDEFKDTEAAAWLAENCYKFGFVLRYPEDKTESTGMDSQSWHFRYVGRYHATRMKILNLSLEEYVEFMGLSEDAA